MGLGTFQGRVAVAPEADATIGLSDRRAICHQGKERGEQDRGAAKRRHSDKLATVAECVNKFTRAVESRSWLEAAMS